MPVLETDFLKGMIDPKDRLHQRCLRALRRLKTREWDVSSTAFLELDLILKGSGASHADRASIFVALRAEIPKDSILGLTHDGIGRAIDLQSKYGARIEKFYFDSLHVATAILLDGVIVSSDVSFDQIEEVERISI